MGRSHEARVGGRVLAWTLLCAGALVMLLPLAWMMCVSLLSPEKAGAAITAGNLLEVFPWDPQWQNYSQALREIGSDEWQGFRDALANSVVVTTLVCAATVLSSSLVGYAMARVPFRGRRATFLVMLGTMMLPGQVTMIPLFLLFRWLGWVDTLLPLIVPACFGSAFFVFMYRQFIAQIPEALLEAARIDGMGHFAIWWRVVLPLCQPVTATCAVFTFIWTWNDFLAPLVYLHSDSQNTLAVALNSFRNQYGGLRNVHLLMAASVVTMIPCILLFIAAQKHFVEGLTRGGVKG